MTDKKIGLDEVLQMVEHVAAHVHAMGDNQHEATARKIMKLSTASIMAGALKTAEGDDVPDVEPPEESPDTFDGYTDNIKGMAEAQGKDMFNHFREMNSDEHSDEVVLALIASYTNGMLHGFNGYEVMHSMVGDLKALYAADKKAEKAAEKEAESKQKQ